MVVQTPAIKHGGEKQDENLSIQEYWKRGLCKAKIASWFKTDTYQVIHNESTATGQPFDCVRPGGDKETLRRNAREQRREI